jgi:hypothetical protein
LQGAACVVGWRWVLKDDNGSEGSPGKTEERNVYGVQRVCQGEIGVLRRVP